MCFQIQNIFICKILSWSLTLCYSNKVALCAHFLLIMFWQLNSFRNVSWRSPHQEQQTLRPYGLCKWLDELNRWLNLKQDRHPVSAGMNKVKLPQHDWGWYITALNYPTETSAIKNWIPMPVYRQSKHRIGRFCTASVKKLSFFVKQRLFEKLHYLEVLLF